jgi:hypothetical protein
VKVMYLEKPERLITWNGGSKTEAQNEYNQNV